MEQEWLDVVDAQDAVIAQRTRREVHAFGLTHRAVSVLIFDPQGRLLIQERSAHKDQDPGRYSPSASGHVDAQESYATAAARELREEVGLTAPLIWLHTLPACPETHQEFTAVFTGHTDDTPRPDPEEVASVRWIDVASLWADMTTHPDRYTSSFRTVLSWFRSQSEARA